MSTQWPGSPFDAGFPEQARCGFCAATFAVDIAACPVCGQPHEVAAYPAPAAYLAPAAYPVPGYPVPTYSDAELADPVLFSQLPPPQSFRRRHGRWIAVIGLSAGVVLVCVIIGLSEGNGTAGPSTAVANVSVAPGDGIVYRSPAAHFAARFPELPDERTVAKTVNAVSIELHVVSDVGSHIGVECEDFSEDVPSQEGQALLDETLGEVASAAGSTLTDHNDNTFQGHAAAEGSFTSPDGTGLSAVIFTYSARRVYVIIAPTGAVYDELKSTFVTVR